jgi:hypothetical protein
MNGSSDASSFACMIFQTTWDLWTDPILQSVESLCVKKGKRTGHGKRNALTDTVIIDAETRVHYYATLLLPIFLSRFQGYFGNP